MKYSIERPIYALPSILEGGVNLFLMLIHVRLHIKACDRGLSVTKL